MTYEDQRIWSRTVRPMAIRVALMSAGFTAVIGLCLLAANSLLHSGERPTVSLAGRQFVVGSPALAIPLALLGITMWALLGSLSRLLVARQVRTLLRSRSQGGRGEAASDDTEVGGPGLLSERLLLEAYLGAWIMVTRLAVLALVLVRILPWAAMLGLVIVGACLYQVFTVRVRAGRRVYQEFREANRAARQGLSDPLVEAIYQREVIIERLTTVQVVVLSATSLGFVLLPLWLVNRSSLALASVWFVLMFQAILGIATQAASLGWRQEAFFGQVDSPREGTPVAVGPRRRPIQGVVLLSAPPRHWPRAAAVAVRRLPEAPTLLVVCDGGGLAGTSLPVLAKVLDATNHSLLAVTVDGQDEAAQVLKGLDLNVTAVAYEEATAVPPSVLASWPAAVPVRLSSNAVADHLFGGVEQPGLRPWLGPCSIISEADAVKAFASSGPARATWLAVLHSDRTPPDTVYALLSVRPEDVNLVIVLDPTGEHFGRGVPHVAGEVGAAAGALVERFSGKPPIEAIIANRSGAQLACALSQALPAARLVLFNPEADSHDCQVWAQVHVSAQSMPQAKWIGAFTHDTGNQGLLRDVLIAEPVTPEG
jgi:hypothetical protein